MAVGMCGRGTQTGTGDCGESPGQGAPRESLGTTNKFKRVITAIQFYDQYANNYWT